MNRWSTAISCALLLGLVVGLPYYGLPFFYDYFEQTFGWSRSQIVLGLPLGTLVTLVLGPTLVRRTPPRTSIIGGSLACGVALAGMGAMHGDIRWYFALWLLYMSGWIFAGPLSHQILLTQLYPERRGTALAVAYFGISIFGASSVAFVARPVTAAFGFETALVVLGVCVMLASPLAWLLLPHVPADPPRAASPDEAGVWRKPAFWWLLLGSTLAISGVGGISQHLKLIFREALGNNQARVDEVFGWALLLMLIVGSCGRFSFAWGFDHLPKGRVIGAAFLLMLVAMPVLQIADRPGMPYLFSLLFGLGMSSDSLLIPILVAEAFGPRTVGRTMGWVLPVNTIGQTWFPYVVTLMWQYFGGYSTPIWIIFGCILAGRFALAMVPLRSNPDTLP